MSKIVSSNEPDVSTRHVSGLIKPEPMALATGFDPAKISPMAPEARAYGSGKIPLSSPQRLGLVDIGNSNLKSAIVPAQDERSPANNDYLANPKLLGSVRSIHWLPSGETPKPPPPEWMSAPESWVVPQDVDAFRRLLERLRSDSQVDRNVPVAWKVSSVQPAAYESFHKCLRKYFPSDSLHPIERSQIPMPLDVEAPDRVGIDRLLAAWGAWKHYSEQTQSLSGQTTPLIVIQAGTAVTVDWINEQGTFCGGAIMPGLTMSLKYMALGTAHLPWLAPQDHPSELPIPGRNTQAAILAGASAGFLGGISYLVSKYRSQWPREQVPVIVSGGDKLSLAESLTQPFQVMDHLVLTSLACLPTRI
jgi:type III pantothenate kinase